MTRALAQVVGLLRELADLKRMRVAHRPGTLAQHLFEDAFAALVAGEAAAHVAHVVTARAVVLTSLGGVDADVLRRGGLDAPAVGRVLTRAFDALAAPIDEPLRDSLQRVAASELPTAPRPRFVERLALQPRAGATMPGKPRLVLDPTENHAEHCALVAIYGVLLAPRYDAAPEDAFLAALVHHLHNAELPDGGFSGEEQLGAELAVVTATFRAAALDELPGALRARVEPLANGFPHADSAAARAFHAADVLDRVLQQTWHAEAAGFTLAHAMDEMEIVHAGPVQAFHHAVLAEAGLG